MKNLSCELLDKEGVCLMIGMKVPGTKCERYHWWLKQPTSLPTKAPACLKERNG